MKAHNAQKSEKDLRVGTFQFLPLPAVSRYLAQIGWDWVLLDMQHGPFNFRDIYECIHTIRTAGSKPYVRVPIDDGSAIQKALDLGAQAIVAPMINSRVQAERAAKAAKYPPLGNRSIGGDPWYHYGADYPNHANDRTSLIVQIEHVDAVRAARQILSVKGVDGCLVGPSDLALSLGLGHSDFEKNPKHRACIRQVVSTCKAVGKPCYIHCATVAEALGRVAEGIDRINLSADVDIFKVAAEGLLLQFRTQFRGRGVGQSVA